MRALAAEGVDLFAANNHALLDAARRGRAAALRELLHVGAGDQDRRYDDALALAARAGHTRIMRLLLRRGADPRAVALRAAMDAETGALAPARYA